MVLAKQNTQLLAKLQEAHKHFSITITVALLFVTIQAVKVQGSYISESGNTAWLYQSLCIKIQSSHLREFADQF